MDRHLRPAHHDSIRWLPKNGEPECILEWFSQMAVKALALAPLYTAVIVTLTLLVVLLTSDRF
jgi:hypothetical protein